MRAVTPFLGLCQLNLDHPINTPTGPETLDLVGNCTDHAAVRMMPPSWKARDLGVDESFSERIVDVFNVPGWSFVGGDIVVGATFKPWYWPGQIERYFRFVGQRQRDGSYRWVPEAPQ
jgi:hypothetical protein